MAIVLFIIFHWYLSLFAQTFFLHRYSAHRMFTMSAGWERFFYLFTWFMQGSSFLIPRAYAIMHRMHHAYSDTEKDPHSPHFFKEVFTMMWTTRKIYNGLATGTIRPEEKFEKQIPQWDALDRFGDRNLVRLLFAATYILFYVAFASQWWMYLFLPLHFLIGPIQGACVNWAGHKYGYRNFDENDHSKNTLFFDFLLLGELFQNNHHHFASRSNFGTKWWEFDPVYPVIRVLDKIRVIRLVKNTA
jgi:stearoyl-CoA desaturase (delta-9 desaturase)